MTFAPLAPILLVALLAAPDYDATRAEMLAAFNAHDYASADDRANALLELRPNYPSLIYNRAVFAALRGDADATLDALRTLAALGGAYRIDAPPFDAHAGAPGFAEVRARFAALARPVVTSTVAYSLAQRDFIPEGLAYDPVRKRLFVGSVRHRRVVAVDADGTESPFIAAGAHGLGSVMGMRADPARNRLWIASATTPQMRPRAGEHATGVWAFRLDDGAFVARHLLDAPDGATVGDVLLAADGALFVSESRFGGVYELHASTGRFDAVIAPGRLRSPQGLALSDDGRRLYVADYSTGLHALDRSDGTLTRLPLAAGVHDYGIDGLYRDGDALIGIQNLFAPHRVARFSLGEDGLSVVGVQVLDAALPDYSDPTLGVVVDDSLLYVANSQWDRFDDDGELPADGLTGPVIRRLSLRSQPGRPPPCSAAEHREFDFWVGYWEVTNSTGKVVGHNDVQRMADTCGILEHWRDAGGHEGMSINAYDPGLGRWTQRWVGAGGTMLWLVGGLEGERMVLTSTAVRETPRGEALDRITWQPLDDGRVTQRWEISLDAGETWTGYFFGTYERTHRAE